MIRRQSYCDAIPAAFATCICATLLPAAGLAQTTAAAYPVKPVRVIVGFPPGSGVDLVTRIVIPRLGEAMGRQFVVDNRGGAGGIIGTEMAAKSPSDGYTLLSATSGMVVTPFMSKVSYSIRDFAPISRMASVPFILVVNPAMPVKSLGELVALARAKPRAVNYASTGNWTGPHLTTELFRRVAKIEITHVPYKGSAPALTDAIGGQVDMIFDVVPTAAAPIKAGQLRGLAITSAQRSEVLPDLPTMAEAGLKGFEVSSWYGIVAPAGTPPDIVGRLNVVIVRALQTADMRTQLQNVGATPIGSTPAEFAAHLRAENARWAEVIRVNQIVAD